MKFLKMFLLCFCFGCGILSCTSELPKEEIISYPQNLSKSDKSKIKNLSYESYSEILESFKTLNSLEPVKNEYNNFLQKVINQLESNNFEVEELILDNVEELIVFQLEKRNLENATNEAEYLDLQNNFERAKTDYENFYYGDYWQTYQELLSKYYEANANITKNQYNELINFLKSVFEDIQDDFILNTQTNLIETTDIRFAEAQTEKANNNKYIYNYNNSKEKKDFEAFQMDLETLKKLVVEAKSQADNFAIIYDTENPEEPEINPEEPEVNPEEPEINPEEPEVNPEEPEINPEEPEVNPDDPEINPDEPEDFIEIYDFRITRLPNKITYIKGEAFSSQGLECCATVIMDGSYKDIVVEPTQLKILYNKDISLDTEDIPNELSVGTHDIYVYYEANYNQFSDKFEIEVFNLKESSDISYKNKGDSITIAGFEGGKYYDQDEEVFDLNAPYEPVYSKPEDFEYIFIEGSSTEIDVVGIKDNVESMITELTIPAVIDGYTVKSVSIGILNYAKEVRTFVIEDGVQEFSTDLADRDYRFPKLLLDDGKKITKMYIPKTLVIDKEDIGDRRFSICLENLQELSIDFTNIYLSSDLSYERFLQTPNLRKITIRMNPNSYNCKGIDNFECLFDDANLLEEIDFVFNEEEFIPSEGQTKPYLSFNWLGDENFKNLKKITYPENCILSIESLAAENSSIESFTFTKNTYVCLGSEAFKNCNNLSEIIFDEGCEFDTRNLSENPFCDSLWSKTVTRLDLSGFDECWLDFSNFTALEEIDIGSSVVRSNFSGCKNLSKVLMNEDAVFLPLSLAETAITSVTLQGNENNTNFYTGYGVSADEIKNGEMPGLFENCNNIKEITFKNCEIPYCIFGPNGTDRTDIVIDYSSAECLSSYAFYKCAFLKEFDITKLKSLDAKGYQFAYCENLEKVTICSVKCQEGVDLDGYGYGLVQGMFYNCSNLETVLSDYPIFDIPNSCFYNCFNLENINLPLSIDKYSYLIIENALGETKTYYMQLFYEVDSFYGALKIANKFVDNNLITDMFPYAFRNAYLSESLTLEDFFVFDFSDFLVRNLIIDDSYYYIPQNFALGNEYLESVILDGEIEAAAFKDCILLNTVIIGDRTFHVVQKNSFEGCVSLEKIIVPKEYYEQYITAECWEPYRNLIVVAE